CSPGRYLAVSGEIAGHLRGGKWPPMGIFHWPPTGDIVKTYNYASRLLFERIALIARDWPGGTRRAITKVAHVRGHDHAATTTYITTTCPATWSPVPVPWSLVTSNIEVAGTGAYDGLQAADVYAGMLNAAIAPDAYGNCSPDYLLECAHQIRRGPAGQVLNFGIKVLGDQSIITGQSWWPLPGK
ncbi:hypothetical protein, partial [Saccharothrix sp. NRRL B-16348]|uniref:hypothetical protein n=1 Tax=Saccharothrix sp. NRRL B-16348 TaxID=1415542 RepID=UPI000ABDBD91